MAYQIGKEPGRKTRPNYLYSRISITLVLFLLGIFGLMVLYGRSLVNYARENVQIMVEIKDGAKDAEVLKFQKRLEGSDFIKRGTVNYVDKEEAAEIMNEALDDYPILASTNPFSDAIFFNLKAHYVNADSLSHLTETIEANIFVRQVIYRETMVENISSNVNRLAIFTLSICLLFVLITILLIHNTIKLDLYSNRFLIKTMQLVGAEWSFIRRPYLVRSVTHGLVSGILAVGALVLVVYFAQQRIPELKTLEDIEGFLLLAVILLGLGMFISWWSTWRSIHRYLKMRLDDLY